MNSTDQIFGSIDNPRSYDLARATIRKWSDLGSSQNSDKGSPVFTTEVLAETSSTAADSFDGSPAGPDEAWQPRSNHGAASNGQLAATSHAGAESGNASVKAAGAVIIASPAVDSLSAETDVHCDKCRGEPLVNGLTCPRCGGKGVEPV